MKNKIHRILHKLLFLLLLPTLCPSTHAANPADADIKGALYDIAKYEQQFGNKTTERATTLNRTLKLLTIARKRLDSSPNKSHASWIDANNRYNALVAHMRSMLAPSQSTTSSTPVPTTQNQAPRTQSPAQMISQQRVRIKKLIRDIASATATMDQAGMLPFQGAEYVSKKQDSLARFQVALAKYAQFQQDPDVVEATNAAFIYQNMIAFGLKTAAAETANLGDVQAQLRAIEQQLKPLPGPPDFPYPSDALTSWIIELGKVRNAAIETVKQLSVFYKRANLPDQRGTVQQGADYDKQDVLRLANYLKNEISKSPEVIATLKLNIDAQAPHIISTLDYFDQLDPTSNSDRENAFLGKDSYDENRKRLADTNRLANSVVTFDTIFKHDTLTKHTEILKRTETTNTQYEANYRQALSLSRMPKAATTSSSLLSTAREVLQKPKYGAASIERIVINSDKVHREKETSETQYDDFDISLSGTLTLSGTKTTYFYAWDQFQATTAEPVGDKYYLFYNTFKIFTSGATTTPLNKWILSNRLQGSEIPKENINLD